MKIFSTSSKRIAVTINDERIEDLGETFVILSQVVAGMVERVEMTQDQAREIGQMLIDASDPMKVETGHVGCKIVGCKER